MVVDQLEVVQVDQQAGQLTADTRGATHLFVRASAHGTVVHAVGDRIRTGLSACAQQCQRRGRLVDKRGRALDGVLIERLGRWRVRTVTASTSPRTASPSSSALPTFPDTASRGTLAASSRAPVATTLWPVLATHPTPGGRSPC